MKKIFIFLLLILCFVFVGCGEDLKKIVTLNITNVELSSEKEEIIYTVEIINDDLITEKNNIKQFNYYYAFGKKDKKELLETQKYSIQNKELIHKISFDESNYRDDISIIFELELSKDGLIYSKVKEINISTVAKESYLKNNENKIAENICNPNRLYTLDIKIEIKGTKGNGEGDVYYYSYTNPSYQKVTLIITLKDKYFFSESLVFIFNGETIDSSKYTVEDNIITYVFNDPNWSIIV